MVLQYASWYRQIRELPPDKQPDDDTIQDDEQLDRWWEQFLRDLSRPSTTHRGPGWKSMLARDGGKVPTFQEE